MLSVLTEVEVFSRAHAKGVKSLNDFQVCHSSDTLVSMTVKGLISTATNSVATLLAVLVGICLI